MKSFLVIGNINSVKFKDVFPHIARNEMWVGCSSFNSGMYFHVPDEYEYNGSYGFERNGLMRVSSICWFTNLDHSTRNHSSEFVCRYDPSIYRKYDNYDAIEVGGTDRIPVDYDGLMGVPISFFDRYDSSKFDVLGIFNNFGYCNYDDGIICGSETTCPLKNGRRRKWIGPIVDDVPLYKRVIVRWKKKSDGIVEPPFTMKP